MSDPMVELQPAHSQRYVGLAVIPRRRRAIEAALGRIVELGGEALLITADGSKKARGKGVEHIDLLNDEMRSGVNRVVAISPKRVAGKLVGRKVGGRSLAWRMWSSSRPYKAVRYYALWHILQRRLGEVHMERVTKLLMAGVESWPIAWHLTREYPSVEIGWDVPDDWRRPPEADTLGLRKVALWGANPTWHVVTRGGPHRAESVTTFAPSSWIAQAGAGVEIPARLVGSLSPDPEAEPSAEAEISFEDRATAEDLTPSLIEDLIASTPDVVVVDALPELFTLAKVGDGFVTLNEFSEMSGTGKWVRENHAELLGARHPLRDELFARALATLVPRLLEALPDSRFVLHRVRLNEGSPRASILADTMLSAEQANLVLARREQALLEAFGQRLAVLAPDPALRGAGTKHLKGPIQAGFASGYNEAALTELDEIVRGTAP